MNKFKVIKTDEVDIKNGFQLGQEIYGEIKIANFNSGKKKVLKVKNSLKFLLEEHVEIMQ